MVRIISLRAENFRRLNITQPLEFPAGFIVIRGRNEAGKSTIIESILFGLYGDYRIPGSLRGGRQGLESLVEHRAGKARVEVVFEVGGRRYRVERIVESGKEGARQVDARLVELGEGGAKLLATGVTKVNEVIQRILRVSWREMLVTNVIAQKDLERIVKMSRSDRDQVINMMMGFESYNKALESLSEELRERRAALDATRREREELAKWVEELEKEKAELEKWRAELDALVAKIPELEVEVAGLEAARKYLSEIEEVLTRRQKVKQEIESARSRSAEIERKLALGKARLEELDREIEGLESERAELEPRLRELERELEKTRLELDRLAKRRLSIEEYALRLGSLTRELEYTRSKIEPLRGRLSEAEVLKREKENAEKTLSELGKAEASVRLPSWSVAGAIFTAAASLLAAITLHPAALAGLAAAALLLTLGLLSKQRQLQQLARRAGELRERLSSIEAELRMLGRVAEELDLLGRREAELARQLEELKAQAEELGVEGQPEVLRDKLLELEMRARGRLEELSATVDSKRKRLYQVSADIESRRREVVRLREEVQRLSSELDELNSRVKRLEAEYASMEIPRPPVEVPGLKWPILEADYELVARLRKEYEKRYIELRGALERNKGRVEELRRRIEETEERLKRLPEHKARLSELDEEIRRLDTEVRAYEEAISALKSVAAQRRALFAPSVESNMSWIISYITNGRYKAVRLDPDSYDVEVYDSEAGRWLRRDIYSGGTNDQFLLAMRIAFTLALLPAAKGTYPRFLFLDEPLGSSDAERRELIVKLLSEELTRLFDQVFLVTHLDVEEPPDAVVIVMDNGKPERVYSARSSEA